MGAVAVLPARRALRVGRRATRRPSSRMKPSEYFRRNCFLVRRGRRGDGAAVRRGVRRRQPRLLDRLPARRLEVSRTRSRRSSTLPLSDGVAAEDPLGQLEPALRRPGARRAVRARTRPDLRNRFRCASLSAMAVATATKIRALKRDFRSGSAIADLLGVNRSQITRWLRGAGIDPLNAEKIDLLELVWSNLLPALRGGRRPGLALRPESAPRRPAPDRRHPHRTGRGADAGDPGRARRRVRVMLHRCFAWDRRARPRRARRGALDPARRSRATGGTTTRTATAASTSPSDAAAAVVEQLARFRGNVLVPGMLRRRGLPLGAGDARARRSARGWSISTTRAVLSPRATCGRRRSRRASASARSRRRSPSTRRARTASAGGRRSSRCGAT